MKNFIQTLLTYHDAAFSKKVKSELFLASEFFACCRHSIGFSKGLAHHKVTRNAVSSNNERSGISRIQHLVFVACVIWTGSSCIYGTRSQ